MEQIMIAAKEVTSSSKAMVASLPLSNPDHFDIQMARFRESIRVFLLTIIAVIEQWDIAMHFSWLLESQPWDQPNDSDWRTELSRRRTPSLDEIRDKLVSAASAFSTTVSDAFYSGLNQTTVVHKTEVDLAHFLKRVIITCYENSGKESPVHVRLKNRTAGMTISASSLPMVSPPPPTIDAETLRGTGPTMSFYRAASVDTRPNESSPSIEHTHPKELRRKISQSFDAIQQHPRESTIELKQEREKKEETTESVAAASKTLSRASVGMKFIQNVKGMLQRDNHTSYHSELRAKRDSQIQTEHDTRLDISSSSEARQFWLQMERRSSADKDLNKRDSLTLGRNGANSSTTTPESDKRMSSHRLVIQESSKYDETIYQDTYVTVSERYLSESTRKPAIEMASSSLLGGDFGEWTQETTRSNAESHIVKGYPLVLPKFYLQYYSTQFINKPHSHWYFKDAKIGTVVASIRNMNTEGENSEKRQMQVLLRSEKANLESTFFASNRLKPDARREILSAFPDVLMNTTEKSMTEMSGPEIQQELIKYEKAQISKESKIGILYCKPGQTTEAEMFCNETGNKHFEDFLDLLATKVTLKGWDRFRGGLDVNRDTTGTHSRYTIFRGFEIMFHVSTYLPFTPDDDQQLERKRHLGNDVVMIVFKEGNTPVSPAFMASHFTHFLVVVQPLTPNELGMSSSNVKVADVPAGEERSTSHYRLSVCSRRGVPSTQPFIHQSTVFHKDDLREFLLLKVLNAETACMTAPAFSQKLGRTRKQLLEAIVNSFVNRNTAS